MFLIENKGFGIRKASREVGIPLSTMSKVRNGKVQIARLGHGAGRPLALDSIENERNLIVTLAQKNMHNDGVGMKAMPTELTDLAQKLGRGASMGGMHRTTWYRMKQRHPDLKIHVKKPNPKTLLQMKATTQENIVGWLQYVQDVITNYDYGGFCAK